MRASASTTIVCKRAGEAYAKKGLRGQWDYLKAAQKQLKDVVKEIDRLIESAECDAVRTHQAAFVYHDRSELPPNKEDYIHIHGTQAFNQCKRLAAPRKTFVWNAN